MLMLCGGCMLDCSQIVGIVYFVFSSVLELQFKVVSVFDQIGVLFFQVLVDSVIGLDGQQLQYKQQVEVSYNKCIFDLFEFVVGYDNLCFSVMVDVDFFQIEVMVEEYCFNQGFNIQVVVCFSQSSDFINVNVVLFMGVFGVVMNQLFVLVIVFINGVSVLLQVVQGGVGVSNSCCEQVINYELDKIVCVMCGVIGSVKCLNVVIVVNYCMVIDFKGKIISQLVLFEEIVCLIDFVKEVMGFNVECGDLVKVIIVFFVVDKIEFVDLLLWKQFWLIDLLCIVIVFLVFVVIVLIVVFGMICLVIKVVVVFKFEEKVEIVDEVVDDVELLFGVDGMFRLEVLLYNEKLDCVCFLVCDNLVVVVNIVCDWMVGQMVI